jgi:hypothetical protein
MSRNMSNLDRGLRSFLIAPVAIILAVVVGAGSIGGILLFARRDHAWNERRRLLPALHAVPPGHARAHAAAALTIPRETKRRWM